MPRYMRRMYSDLTNGLPFMKMHGLGNDFVVIDERAGGRVSGNVVRASDRREPGVYAP